jgi:hypothetical protein
MTTLYDKLSGAATVDLAVENAKEIRSKSNRSIRSRVDWSITLF